MLFFKSEIRISVTRSQPGWPRAATPYWKARPNKTKSAPKASARSRKRVILTGDVPSPINPPSGCHFHARCPYAMARCKVEAPALREVVRRQRLLEPTQLAELAGDLSTRFPEPRSLAQELIRRDWPTPYQVNQRLMDAARSALA